MTVNNDKKDRLAHNSFKFDLVPPDTPKKIGDFFWWDRAFCSNFIAIHPNLFEESTERWKLSEKFLGKVYRSYLGSANHNLVFF